MDLHNLIEHYGSDKNLSGYTPIYSAIFEPLRHESMNVLEIGIGTLLPDIPSTFIGNTRTAPHYTPGGSLRVWRDYFPKSWVFGGDIAEDCLFEEERITTFLFDSTNREECDKVLGALKFNIIVDDGLHLREAQYATLENLWDRLKPKGLYVIEDILRPDLFKAEITPKIRWLTNNMNICHNVRGNLLFIQKP